LSKLAKTSAATLLLLLATMVLTTAMSVYAQDQTDQTDQGQYPPNIPLPEATGATATSAFVTVYSSVGGTTNPTPGQYTYPQGEWFNITATPYHGYRFAYWQISGQYLPGHNLPPIQYPDVIPEDYVPAVPNPSTAGWDSLVTSQNPLNVICGYGYNFQYQPVFQLITTQSPGNDTIVNMLQTIGGTTNPGPGTHTYAHTEASSLRLTATPASGYEFKYWVASGQGTNAGPNQVILDNPADISCQAGYTYQYEPVFVPSGATTTTETGIPAMYVYAAIIVLVIVAVIGIAAALMYRSRMPKK
jgi:hypothetical protein